MSMSYTGRLGQDAPLMVSAGGGKFVLKDARETPDTLDALIEYPGFTLQASFYHTNARPIEGRDYGIAFYGTQATMLLTREGFEVWPEGDHTQPIRSEGSALDGPVPATIPGMHAIASEALCRCGDGTPFNHSCATRKHRLQDKVGS